MNIEVVATRSFDGIRKGTVLTVNTVRDTRMTALLRAGYLKPTSSAALPLGLSIAVNVVVGEPALSFHPAPADETSDGSGATTLANPKRRRAKKAASDGDEVRT